MTTPDITLDPELQRVLWACRESWRVATNFGPNPLICYRWILPQYEGRFGMSFHQSRLQRLAAAGFLKRDLATRRGNRRYYRLLEPNSVDRLVEGWCLS